VRNILNLTNLNFSVSETVSKLMKKHSLSTTGLSLSQAQSISNLCFQRTQDIANALGIINNSEKTINIGGETYIETKGNQIPKNVVDLILEKGLLHSTQAFLMENIKAKDILLKELKSKSFISPLEYPEYPTLKSFLAKELVDEKWGWEQLSTSEYNEYLEVEAYAAHIGQFIHKGERLDVLRKELFTLKTLEWMTIEDGKRTPLKVVTHHTPEQLLEVHNNLAAMHRKYEQRVNYFKAKVKNLVTEENARISKENADIQAEINSANEMLRNQYNTLVAEYEANNLKLKQKFEQLRQEDIQKTAQLRISVDNRFQNVIDSYLKQLD
jgi:hypothetical protein